MSREKIYTALSPRWQDIGILMDFDDDGYTLDEIEADNIKVGVEACFKNVFQLWLCGKARVAPTLTNLLEILNDCSMKTLANDIKKTLPVSLFRNMPYSTNLNCFLFSL